MASRVPAEAAKGLPMSEAELFGWVLEHGAEPKHTKTAAGNFQHQTRRGRGVTAASWFLRQFDISRLLEAFQDPGEFDPNAPTDIMWMVKKLRDAAANGKPAVQNQAWARLRELQRIGALAHPELQKEVRRREVAAGQMDVPPDDEDYSWGDGGPGDGGSQDKAELQAAG